MADGPPSELALPPPGFEPQPVDSFSGEVKEFTDNFSQYMLRPSHRIPWRQIDQTRSYWSPTYRGKTAKLELALRLFRSGMLRFCAQCLSAVTMFTVVKGYDEQGNRTLRPVWDQRGPNLMWRKPPWCSMGSPGCFSTLDLSHLGPGSGLGSHVGDLPNFFYGLMLPPHLWPFFGSPQRRHR